MDGHSTSTNVVRIPGPETALLDDQVGHLLRSAHKRASAVCSEVLGSSELTPAQYFALARLQEVGRLSQNHLGRLTAMDPATIQGVVQRLQARGLVERTADKYDRRRKVLQLTPAGRSMIEQLQGLTVQANDAILAPLNAGEREIFMRLLRRIA